MTNEDKHKQYAGINNPFFGKHHTEQTKSRISLAKTGKPINRLDLTGQKINNLIVLRKEGRIDHGPRSHHITWRCFCLVCKQECVKASYLLRGKKKIFSCGCISKSAERNHNWRGGKSGLNFLIRGSAKYRNLRNSVFKRDNYTCLICDKKGGNLEIHHIVAINKIIEDILQANDFIKSRLTASEFFTKYLLGHDLLWDKNNIQLLCRLCHEKTDNYGPKSQCKKKLYQFKTRDEINQSTDFDNQSKVVAE